jgi:hypothetical protein
VIVSVNGMFLRLSLSVFPGAIALFGIIVRAIKFLFPGSQFDGPTG